MVALASKLKPGHQKYGKIPKPVQRNNRAHFMKHKGSFVHKKNSFFQTLNKSSSGNLPQSRKVKSKSKSKRKGKRVNVTLKVPGMPERRTVAGCKTVYEDTMIRVEGSKGPRMEYYKS